MRKKIMTLILSFIIMGTSLLSLTQSYGKYVINGINGIAWQTTFSEFNISRDVFIIDSIDPDGVDSGKLWGAGDDNGVITEFNDDTSQYRLVAMNGVEYSVYNATTTTMLVTFKVSYYDAPNGLWFGDGDQPLNTISATLTNTTLDVTPFIRATLDVVRDPNSNEISSLGMTYRKYDCEINPLNLSGSTPEKVEPFIVEPGVSYSYNIDVGKSTGINISSCFSTINMIVIPYNP